MRSRAKWYWILVPPLEDCGRTWTCPLGGMFLAWIITWQEIIFFCQGRVIKYRVDNELETSRNEKSIKSIHWNSISSHLADCCFVAKLCPTHCNPMDCSLPGFSVHGILQARILEWVAISFSRGSSQPRDQTLISCLLLWQTDSWVAKFASERNP